MKQYSFLSETTVARRLVDTGKIVDPKIIRMFKRKGWIPTKKKELIGLSKGADNMFRKAGYKPVTKGNLVTNSGIIPKNTSSRDMDILLSLPAFAKTKLKAGDAFIPKSPYAYAGKKGILPTKHLFATDIKVTPAQAAIVKWHEAREAARGMKSIGKKYQKIVDKARIDNPLAVSFELQPKTGMHMPGVLGDERKLSQRLIKRHNIPNFQDNIASIEFESPKVKSDVLSRIADTYKDKPKAAKTFNMSLDGNFRRHDYERKIANMTPKQDYQFRKKILDDAIKSKTINI